MQGQLLGSIMRSFLNTMEEVVFDDASWRKVYIDLTELYHFAWVSEYRFLGHVV